MFDVPDAKRVRRDELYSSESEGDAVAHRQEDAATRAKLNERLARMYSLDVVGPGAPGAGDSDEELPDAPADGDDQEEPAFEFRLFSTAGSAPKVVVNDEDDGDGAILSSRPKSFHLKEDFTPEELERFRQVAVEYTDIVQGAQQRAWGLEVPWRVTKITVKPGPGTSSTVQKGGKSKTTTEEPDKRKRPGKKRRIAFRIKENERIQKEEERKAKEEAAAKHRLTKEEHLKEKKKRLNREKKLKRRQKEKEKKMAGKSGGEGAGDDHSSSGSESDES
ncbi:hypothetical protein CONLIGDRAFT_680699 [Coniochaeta ligniaria NRRL 30616]|uniref:Uncharacterized protein n=1 Tax=Coniochaeta ligniaria NRRL 30616 TaxID=1408157 RepID=A0A1J7IR02_9PEZI|nr:hypothetical protein CONLIGDRAFT_680699 [Coniochaeta ligniaria NRRL 30616]